MVDADPGVHSRGIPAAAGGITLVGTITRETVASDQTVDVNLPGSLSENDYVIMNSFNDSTAGQITVNTSNWTELTTAVATDMSFQIFGKKMGVTPDTVVNVLIGAAAADTLFTFGAFRGVDTATQMDTTPTVSSGASGDPDCPSITTVTDGALILAIGALDDDIATSVTEPSGYSTASWGTYGTAGAGGTSMWSYLIKVTAGSDDPAAYSTDGSDAWRSATLALRPA